MVYKSSPNLSFFSLIMYLTLWRVSHSQTLYITNASGEEEPRHFLIYHRITDQDTYSKEHEIGKTTQIGN